MTTLYALLQKNPNHWRDVEEECALMRQWAFNPQAQAELRAEVGRERSTRFGLIRFRVRVNLRCDNFLHKDVKNISR